MGSLTSRISVILQLFLSDLRVHLRDLGVGDFEIDAQRTSPSVSKGDTSESGFRGKA